MITLSLSEPLIFYTKDEYVLTVVITYLSYKNGETSHKLISIAE